MVAAFQTVMELSATKASMVQFAFYGGYATMALPAAFFIRKYSFKHGIILGLALYAIGAFLFIPAALALHPHIRLSLLRDHGKPFHPVAWFKRNGYTTPKPCSSLQPYGLAFGHGSSLVYCVATAMERS